VPATTSVPMGKMTGVAGVAAVASLAVSAMPSWIACRYPGTSRSAATATATQHPSAAVFPNGEAMAAMSARAVAAMRYWDAQVTAEHGPDALWLACTHGDVIKAIVADAMGLHLDQFQRLVADPASVSVIRYTPTRPFLVRLNDTADLAALVPKDKAASSDAAVGGGAGA